MLALEAAAAWARSWIGVDLLPDGDGGWIVLELNGAVEFNHEYALDRDPLAAAAWELAPGSRSAAAGPVRGAAEIRLTA